MEINRGIGALLRHEARRYFRESPNISKALGEIRRNPEPYNTRFALFHAVLDELNEIQMSGGDPGEGYLHAGTLGDSDYLTHMPFPTPEYAALVRGERVVYSARETFVDINTKIKTDEWEFPGEVTDPNVLTSALLIEGYGLFLEKLTGEEGVARKFVLSFEEVLWNKFRDSEMLNDVLPWMIEERNEFSPKMRSELEQLVIPQPLP